MRILKTHVLLRFVNSYIVDSPQPANITYLWNFGSLLATCLVIQILTGAFLAMKKCVAIKFHYMLETPKDLYTTVINNKHSKNYTYETMDNQQETFGQIRL
ncbi:hypothetical protein AGABI1DRAFT_49128 [Agaricus bisporus var. burnettii JB137-S8]|uniref:Cytochrome b/b6 N-terminal region profile domain-containing protein n=1 Tax=Agaricus bisporus var. burnettii (strain JB137-S8 / ATCC MYA-4627 / FGSC 10392) TaxID=597362 RepID=K5WTD1_AGABU|nr:uncharacterized protein AGABI1DRAFT_49128 [Agaricus bisporus var. burnettii JB137-S8]EKM73822.1 hypothetical protein AGABI1DRAFT_49128 [Agaricus bisporus var. burnettii JB137-S8]